MFCKYSELGDRDAGSASQAKIAQAVKGFRLAPRGPSAGKFGAACDAR